MGHLRRDQLHSVIDELLTDLVDLVKHPYGCHVIQHLIEHGTLEQRREVMHKLQKHVRTMQYDGVTCGVIARALEHAETEDSLAFALKLIRVDGLIVRISLNRQGHLIAKMVFKILKDHVVELER